jgi:hypothetical protein
MKYNGKELLNKDYKLDISKRFYDENRNINIENFNPRVTIRGKVGPN